MAEMKKVATRDSYGAALVELGKTCDDLVVLDGGRVVFAGTREECLEKEVLESTFCLKRYTVADGEEKRIFLGPN